MTLKALLFDLDNTLLDRKTAFLIFSNRFIDAFVEVRDQDQRNKILIIIRSADRNGYRDKGELFQELKATLAMKNPAITLDELLDFWYSEFFKCTVVMEGAQEVLEYLRQQGFKLGIISNGSGRVQNAKIDQAGLRKYFDTIVLSQEAGVKKPDQRIFDIALQQLQVMAASCWYVGDHPVKDIQAARDAGLHPVWLQTEEGWDETVEKPEMTITKLRDLETIVRNQKRKL